MRKAELVFVGFALATIVFAIAFVYPMFTEQSVVWYYPLEHRWALEVKPNGLAMDFYGRTLLATIAASVAFVVGVLAFRRKSSIQPRTLGLLAGWALTATLFVMAYFAWTLHERRLVPSPIPDWYQAR